MFILHSCLPKTPFNFNGLYNPTTFRLMRKIKPGSFDLVISDMTMPNMTGDQLAREVIAIQPDIPIIICTGFSERLNQEKAAIIGVKGFLMKPIVKAEIAKMVRKVFDEAKG